MLKTVDVGLMANHLSAHIAIVKRLEMYSNYVKNLQILNISVSQIGVMRNHVKVMNQLLDPKLVQVTLPPIPSSEKTFNPENQSFDMNDRDIAIDAHFTASAMAKDNFNSSENMKDNQVKKIHSEMASQQSTIAGMYEDLINQLGWMNQPNATVLNRTSAITPLNVPVQNMTNSQQSNNTFN